MKAAIQGFNGGIWAFRLVFAVVVAELLIVAGAVVCLLYTSDAADE